MLKKFGEALFFVFLIWLAWVLILGATPEQRMDRACTAVSGPGNFLSAAAAALNNDWGNTIERSTVSATYRCRLTLWNFFYAKAWADTHPGQPLPGSQPAPGYSPLVLPGASAASAAVPPPAAQAKEGKPVSSVPTK
jgi:hypothetical protein